MIHSSEERSRVFDIELVIFELKDLVFVNIELRIGLKEGLYGSIHDCSARVV